MLFKTRSSLIKIKSKNFSKTRKNMSMIERTRFKRTQSSGLTMLSGPVSSLAQDWSLLIRTSLICSALLQMGTAQTPDQRLNNKRMLSWVTPTFWWTTRECMTLMPSTSALAITECHMTPKRVTDNLIPPMQASRPKSSSLKPRRTFQEETARAERSFHLSVACTPNTTWITSISNLRGGSHQDLLRPTSSPPRPSSRALKTLCRDKLWFPFTSGRRHMTSVRRTWRFWKSLVVQEDSWHSSETTIQRWMPLSLNCHHSTSKKPAKMTDITENGSANTTREAKA